MNRNRSQPPIAGFLALAGLGAATAALGALSISQNLWPKRNQLSLAEWEAARDIRGRLYSSEHLLRKISSVGIEPCLRISAWPFLLGVYSTDSTAKQREAEDKKLDKSFTKLLHQAKEKANVQGSATEEVHRSIILDVLRTHSILQGTLEGNGDSVDCRQPMPANANRHHHHQQQQQLCLSAVHCTSPAVWCSLDEAGLDTEASSRATQLFNMLAAHHELDPHLSYAQGMSDLGAMFVLIFGTNNSSAFWCFAALMLSLRANFDRDEIGICSSLGQIASVLERADAPLMRRLEDLGAKDCLFAYRMVIVQLLRELAPAQAVRLWEMSWAAEALNTQPRSMNQPLWLCSAHPLLKDGLKHEQKHAAKGGQKTALTADDKACPPLLQCYIVEAICNQRQTILNECTDRDTVLALFNMAPPAQDFNRLLDRALRLRAKFLPQQSIEELLTLECSP